MDDRNVALPREPLDRPLVACPDLGQQRRRGDREATIKQEADERRSSASALRPQKEAIDETDLQDDTVAK